MGLVTGAALHDPAALRISREADCRCWSLADLGGRPGSTFWRVTVPLTMPGICRDHSWCSFPASGNSSCRPPRRRQDDARAATDPEPFAVARNKPFGPRRLRAHGRGPRISSVRPLHEAQGSGRAPVRRVSRFLARARGRGVRVLYAPIAILVLFSFNRDEPDGVWEASPRVVPAPLPTSSSWRACAPA